MFGRLPVVVTRTWSLLKRWMQEVVAVGRTLLGDIASTSVLGAGLALLVGACFAAALVGLINSILLESFLERSVAPRDQQYSVESSPWQEIGKNTIRILVRPPQGPILADLDYFDGGPSIARGAKPLRQYLVQKVMPPRKPEDQPAFVDVLLIEVDYRKEKRTHEMHLQLAFQAKNGQWRLIRWWETKGLARSDALLIVQPDSMFGWAGQVEVSFPTSPSALNTWLRTYFARHLQADKIHKDAVLSEKEVETAVVAELERILNYDLGGLQTCGPVLTLRILNGWVQWCTIWFFLSACTIIAARWIVWVKAEDPQRISLTKHESENELQWLKAKHDETDLALGDHKRRWGTDSVTLMIWLQSLRGQRQDPKNVAEKARDFSEIEQEVVDAKGWMVRFLLTSMPALGFIGTVLGIGNALGGTSAVLSDELAKQQSGVAAIGLNLAFAFDTTFVALVLTLVASFFHGWVEAREKTVVMETRRQCLLVLGGINPALPAAPATAPPPIAALPPVPPVQPAPRENAPPAPTLDSPDDYRTRAVVAPTYAAVFAVALAIAVAVFLVQKWL